jgi:trk system potassium uptake protein TrkH
VLLVLSIGIASVDFAAGLRGIVSVGLTALQTVLVLPWLLVVTRAPPGAEEARARTTGRAVLLIATAGLLLVVLVAKWRVLIPTLSEPEIVPLAQYRTYGALSVVFGALGLIGAHRLERFLASMADHPARLMVVSFGLTATLGGLLLTLPFSLVRVADASLVDGLFTSVSAVCVTGLAVNNVSQTYTLFGQGVICALIQVGGLGIMVLSAFFSIVAGRRLRVRSTAVMAEMVDADSFASFRRSVAGIVLFTLVIELAGVLVLYKAFTAYPEIAHASASEASLGGARGYAWAAVFHAVSAFCNAGFSIFRDGLVPFVGSWPVSLAVMALIVVGGIGFPVLDELVTIAVHKLRRRRAPRLTLHARVVLSTTALLIVLGMVCFLLLEWRATLSGRPWHTRLLASAFQSVTTRTAGFNTLDFGAMQSVTLLVTCVLMFVGGSPGSTAGGIKTTTLATLFASLRAELRGFEAARLLRRALPDGTVRRAMGVSVLSVGIVVSIIFLLLLTERHEPMRLVFEAVSAFGTVGLSTGITPELSVPGKLIISGAMFVGRIGPLTLALAIATRSARSTFRLPEERVAIG